MEPDTEAVVFFCHGSPDPGWRAPFDALVATFRARHPGRRAALCFLERMTPGLPETIDALAADGVRAIRVVPLFLAPGAHTRRDLPAMLAQARERWPGLAIRAGATLAEDPALRDAIVAAAAAGIAGDDAAGRSS
jgi:sirohydrochlorin cobaltochelatase